MATLPTQRHRTPRPAHPDHSRPAEHDRWDEEAETPRPAGHAGAISSLPSSAATLQASRPPSAPRNSARRAGGSNCEPTSPARPGLGSAVQRLGDCARAGTRRARGRPESGGRGPHEALGSPGEVRWWCSRFAGSTHSWRTWVHQDRLHDPICLRRPATPRCGSGPGRTSKGRGAETLTGRGHPPSSSTSTREARCERFQNSLGPAVLAARPPRRASARRHRSRCPDLRGPQSDSPSASSTAASHDSSRGVRCGPVHRPLSPPP